jgi:hypothetical protein
MDIAKLLSAVDDLSLEELEVVKEHVRQREAELWGEAFEEAAAEFRGDSTPDELSTIFEAINQKSPSSDKVE